MANRVALRYYRSGDGRATGMCCRTAPQTAASKVSRWALGALKRVCAEELELELILSQMAQKPMLRGEVGAEDESDVTLSLKVATFCF